jgi:ankyrin repeat protein
MSSIMRAIEGGHITVFRLLLERGADIAIQDKVSQSVQYLIKAYSYCSLPDCVVIY